MLRYFLIWWCAQLAGLLPRQLRGPARATADSIVVSPVEALRSGVRSVAIAERRRGRESGLGQIALAGAPEGLPDVAGRPAVLRLSATDVLETSVVLPLAAERDVDQVLSFEMDRETPFKSEEIYWNHEIERIDRPAGRFSVRLALVQKTLLDPLLAALARFGIAPQHVEIGDGPAGGMILPLDGNRGRSRRPSRRLLRSAATCCALLGLGAVVTPFILQDMALATLDREIAQARTTAAEAEALRREIDRLSGGAEFIDRARAKVGRPLAALAAATRSLPDDTYLTDVELHQGKVTLTGRSAAASRLIAALAANGAFRNPIFSAPVTHLEAHQGEAFTITAETGP